MSSRQDPFIRPTIRDIIRDCVRPVFGFSASRISYLFRAALNASNTNPLTALTGTNVTQVATGSVVIPDSTGTLITIGANLPAIPGAAYSGGNWSAPGLGEVATVLASGLTRYTGGGQGNPSLGVLCEPIGSNLLARSEDVSVSPWVSTGTATAPNATTINLPAVGDYRYQQFTAAMAIGDKITAQCVLSGSGTVTLRFTAGGATNSRITLTGTPTKYTFTHTAVSTDAGPLELFIGRVDAGDTATSVTATRIMVEKNSVATTYTKTEASAVTRPARYSSILGAEIGSKLRFDLVSNEALSSAGRTTTLFDDLTRKVKYQSAGLLVFRDESQVMGSELVTNGTLDSDITGWGSAYESGIISWDATGKAKVSGNTTSSAYITQSFAVDAGKTYKLSWAYSGTQDDAQNAFIGAPVANTVTRSGGTATTYITPTASGVQLLAIRNSSAIGQTSYFDDIVFKEVAELTHAVTLNADTIYEIGIDMGTAASMHINGTEVATATFPAASQFSGTTFVGSKVVSGTASETLNGQISVIESSSSSGFAAGGTE